MTNSLDTNILIYAANEDSQEHAQALKIVQEMLANPQSWILADQVLFELYKALRNPRILEKPLTASTAAEHIRFLREDIGVARCCYELSDWAPVWEQLAQSTTPAQRTHDIVLGVTLKKNGVEAFYTRNTKDFQSIGFSNLINPIDG